jgi:hypothetical protein
MTLQQTESFVPLTAAPASAERREFRVTVLNSGSEKQKVFHSLEPVRSPAAPLAGKKICEPRVTVQRDNGRVTHLRVQCTCGQVLDLACVYDETASAA